MVRFQIGGGLQAFLDEFLRQIVGGLGGLELEFGLGDVLLVEAFLFVERHRAAVDFDLHFDDSLVFVGLELLQGGLRFGEIGLLDFGVEFDEQVAGLDGGAGLDVDGFHDAGDRRTDFRPVICRDISVGKRIARDFDEKTDQRHRQGDLDDDDEHGGAMPFLLADRNRRLFALCCAKITHDKFFSSKMFW